MSTCHTMGRYDIRVEMVYNSHIIMSCPGDSEQSLSCPSWLSYWKDVRGLLSAAHSGGEVAPAHSSAL